ncbi:MAG TPA: histidine phosphatase family protein [Hanamia sp.]|nr:histidine phosphatase family protein [Hanamia sp.]
MKTLLLIRHAKSSWESSVTLDFERPLNERGKNDAPKMAERLLDKKISIDAFVSSPAKRAQKTAEIFMKKYGSAHEKLTLIPSLYEASVDDFYRAVEQLPDEDSSIALFAHNPGITDFINSLDCSPVYNMPTCAIYAFKIKTKHWKEIRTADKEFLFFDYPKNKD